jgi:cardiolipin synthase
LVQSHPSDLIPAAIAAAERSIRVGNAYFIPDDLTTRTLIEAVERGVSVEVLLPGPNQDSLLVRAASRHRWGPLLKGGVKIFEYQPTMYHCKCMVIDGVWTSVGSANFDNRSFRINDEANLNVVGREFAEEEERRFEEDKRQSVEVTYPQWRRPVSQRLTGGAAALLRSQL